MHNLLTDPIITVRTPQGRRHVDLPTLFALLAQGEVSGFLGVRAHQQDPWHVFLVQLAASIRARLPTETLPTDSDYWRKGLLDLAEGSASAWELLVEDLGKPAFLQHPIAAPLKDIKAASPDELDILVTAKNHDVKISRTQTTDVEAWLYALVVYQTMSGYLGAGNYGVVRMNGGFGHRAIVSWSEHRHPSKRWQEETALLVSLRDAIASRFNYQKRGVVLTWLTPWDRKQPQFSLSELEPYFIEATRAIRLDRTDAGMILARSAATTTRQIGPKNLDNGDVGDPWIPINVGDKKKGRSALTIPEDGFTPERLTALLFQQGYELTELQQPRRSSGPGWFIASALVRGQGKTGGFHRVELPVPAKARMVLLNREAREDLGKFAETLLKDAADVGKAYGTALASLAEGGPDELNFDRDTVKNWVSRRRLEYSKQWREQFFETLWRAVDENREAVRGNWQQSLVNEAYALLQNAWALLPLPRSRYWRAVTRAEGFFRARLAKEKLPPPSFFKKPSDPIKEDVA